MQTVAITGASGFVGRALIDALRSAGHDIVALTRDPARHTFPPDVETRRFDPNEPKPNPVAFEGIDAVVNLSGETVDGRWTPEKKRRIQASRVDGTKNVVASLAACGARPRALVSASAVGYYGDRGDEPLTETSNPGNDFLAGVVSGWEAAAREAETLGIRTAMLRTGIVLGDGGALSKMKLPFQLGIGGPFGSGRQFVPWIHLEDLAALYRFALENETISGPMNAVAPDYATSARFAQALGAALKRPALAPAPAFALKIVLGEFADTIVGGQLPIPAVAEDSGFQWKYPRLESALLDVFARGGKAKAVQTFRGTQFVPRSLDEVYDFFSDPRNLQAITPPFLRFSVRSAPPKIERGSVLEYALSMRGLPMRWKTMIAEVNAPNRFVDVQLHGPYALWEHTHEFRAVEGGTEIADTVVYSLPFAPFGEVARSFVRRDIEEIFAYRNRSIGKIFEPISVG
jgi:uncharacterized protein